MAKAVVGLWCTVSALAAGQGASAPPQGAQQLSVLKPGPAVILGRVVEAGTTIGVSHGVVTLTGHALGAPTALFSNGVAGGPRRVMADAQGQFLFRDLPAGAYNISSTAAGYVDGAYGQPFIRRPLDLPRALDVTDADKPISVTIQMWKMGGISGRVTDETGEPMAGAPISVLARFTNWGAPVTQVAANVTTDDRGMYHADVVPGDYIIGLLAATMTVPASAVDGFLQAQREGGATMQAYMNQVVASGTLLPRGVGVRVGNLMVSQFGMRNAWVVPPVMAEDGRLSFYPTTFHPSSVTGASASVVTLASEEEKTGIDLQLRPVPARRVSGRVVGPNGPVAGIALRLASDSSMWTTESVAPDTPQALTDANGEFTFVGIAPNSYTIRVLRTPTTDAEPTLWAADPIVVAADKDLTDLQVRLQTGATIGGHVVVEASGPPPAPEALRAIRISPVALPGSAGALMGFQVRWVVRPDENNRFMTRQVVPGLHTMLVTSLPAGWTLKSVTAGEQNAVDKPIDVTANGITDLVVTITDQVSTLTGTARDANGQSAPQATVAVFPADKSLWPPPGVASRRIQTAAPGRDGRYSFRGLPAGEYFVVAADWPADFSDTKVLATLVSAVSRVTMSGGEIKTQDVRVMVKR